MKAYPLIYSRTYYEDFVPDFFARPDDAGEVLKFDVDKALEYMESFMKQLGKLDKFRYTVFSEGSSCIIGLGCNLDYLTEQVRIQTGETFTEVEQYFSDCKGRPIKCFIGCVIPLSERKNGKIPVLNPEQCLNIYVEHLKKQWESRYTKSELVGAFELEEKEIPVLSAPLTKRILGREVLRNFGADVQKQQEIFDYYVDQILNRQNQNASFISEIRYQDEWEELYSGFKNIAVSEELYQQIQSEPSEAPIKQKEAVGANIEQKVSSRKQDRFGGLVQSSALDEEEAEKAVKSQINMSSSKTGQSAPSENSEKPLKKNKSPRWIPIAIAAGAILLAAIIFGGQKDKQTKAEIIPTKQDNQTEQTVKKISENVSDIL